LITTSCPNKGAVNTGERAGVDRDAGAVDRRSARAGQERDKPGNLGRSDEPAGRLFGHHAGDEVVPG
jgi:hypothetical protein